MKVIYKLINNKTGSSLILVLIVMLLLISFGTISLSISLENTKLAHKTKRWNEDYYCLDMAAEKMLDKIDGYLAKAENAAVRYMSYELYTQEVVNQRILRNMENSIRNKQAGSGINFTLSAILNAPIKQKYIYKQWKRKVSNVSSNDIEYNTKMNDFFLGALLRIYYEKAKEVLYTIEESDVICIDEKIVNYTFEPIDGGDYIDNNNFDDWNNYEPEDTRTLFVLELTYNDRKLIVKANVKAPNYESINNNNRNSIKRTDAQRYKIIEWRIE